MDYELMEKAVEILHEVILEERGISPSQYAIQGQDGTLFLNYAPGEDIEFLAFMVVNDREHVESRIRYLNFMPVWEDTETGQRRIYA